jgi:diguanylate cyclase (GGDEF)-like protein
MGTLEGIEALLEDLAQLLLSETPPERVLPQVADRLGDLVPHDRLVIYRAEPSGRLLLPELVRDPHADRVLSTGPVPFGRGVPGAVAESGRPELIDDVLADARRQHLLGVPDRPESMIAVPLTARGELKGVLCLGRLGGATGFSPDEFRLAIRFGTLAALFIDNTEIRARLEQDTVTDHLTGLYNHRHFHERLSEEVGRAQRHQSTVALLLFDLDDFRAINEAEGHRFGDHVLQVVADVSRRTCRVEDPVCRIGGEEFAVILPGQSVQDALALGERIRTAVSDTTLASPYELTVSVGVAGAPFHGRSSRILYDRASVALARAKERGKNQVRAYEGSVESARVNGDADPSSATRLRWAHDAADVPRADVRSVAQIETLHMLSGRLTRAHDAVSVERALCQELTDLLGCHGCRLYLVDSTRRMLIPVLVKVDAPAESSASDHPMPLEAGLAGRAVSSGCTVSSPATNHCELGLPRPGVEGSESALAAPLRHGDRMTGVIVLCKAGADCFDRDDERMIEIAASLAAVALENVRLSIIQGQQVSAITR